MTDDMNNLQVFMNQKKMVIDNIVIDFMGDFSRQLKDFFSPLNNNYLFNEEITYLSEKANILITISHKIEIYITFKEYIYLDNTILDSKIVCRFIKKYPILASSYELINPMKLDFNNSNIVWDNLSFIYDAKQAAITLLIAAECKGSSNTF